MATNIKITALSDITSANMTYNDLLAVVDMNGTPETKKSTVQLAGNLILAGAGGSNFVPAAIATLAGDVTNAAQPNITSVGNLTSANVTGNLDAGNVNATTAVVAAYFSGDGANLTNLPAGTATKITDGTSNVDIPTTDGNVTVGVGGTADVLIITSTGANVTGTLNATGIITGDAGGISNVVYANVTGTPTLGNISTINIDGNVSNVLRGDGTFAADADTAYGDSNVVTLLNAFGSNTITTTGIVTVGSVTLLNNAKIKDTAGDAVAFGVNAGLTSQGNFSVAMGYLAGTDTQGTRAVAIGHFAGETSQRADAVAIGSQAGETSQGVAAVAIGALAGETAQGNNSIIINATSAALNQTTPNTFTVAPVRNDTSNIAEVLFYNTTSKEVTYSNTINVSGNISAGQFIGDGGGISNVAGANVSGTVALATTSETVSTAAQPNITSTGTLTSLTVSGNITGQSYISATTAIQTTPVVVASLPAAATAGSGARAFVSDANDTAFNAIVAGSGANNLPVFSDGTDWRIG